MKLPSKDLHNKEMTRTRIRGELTEDNNHGVSHRPFKKEFKFGLPFQYVKNINKTLNQ